MTDDPVDEPLRAAARAVVDYDGPVPGDLGLLVAQLKEALAATSPSAAGATPPGKKMRDACGIAAASVRYRS